MSSPSYSSYSKLRYFHSFFKPFIELARWHRTIGALLLYVPCCWGLALANAPTHFYLLFAIGAFALRGAGCTYNDWCDARYDLHVARTKHRPLASGRVPYFHAFLWGLIQVMSGVVVLCFLPIQAWWWAIAALPFIVVYPLMKRWTHFAQIFLGLTFSWGALMAYASASGSLSWQIWVIYATGIFWTVIYDTVYAYQDVDDDRRLGLKSIPVWLGDQPWRFLRYIVSGLDILPTLVLDRLWPLWMIACGAYGFILKRLDVHDSLACRRFFGPVSLGLGITLWILLLMESWL